MTALERRATLSLASVYAVRMLGLFMILPVFALYSEQLAGVTPLLVGLAIGIYGLTQAIFQIPLGTLSDHIGRKPVILGGLVLFTVGSVVAAMSDTIHGVILGRALQGSGAIAAAVMALAADLTREEHRTKVMAMIGMSIGMSFALALIAGPMLNQRIGVHGIFWLTALMSIVAMGIVAFVVPRPVRSGRRRDTGFVVSALKTVLGDSQLLRLDLGVFVLHLVLTANFVVLPLLLRDQAGLEASRHWILYLPVMFVSFLLMLPFIIIGEKKRVLKRVMVGAIALLALSEGSFVYTAGSLVGVTFSLLGFFAAFNLLEASLPSLVSKTAPPDIKGSSMGVYSTSQFLGAFAGGALGGALTQSGGATAVFAGGSVCIVVWLAVASTMRNPRYLSSYILNIGALDSARARDMAERLHGIAGVAEAVVIPEDGVAYLKVDRHELDERQLREIAVSPV
ncbi:MAG: MFS transporter [Pseudomonadota bacterium]|nr:MFS transporter [Pseudomonadota bacterium]